FPLSEQEKSRNIKGKAITHTVLTTARKIPFWFSEIIQERQIGTMRVANPLLDEDLAVHFLLSMSLLQSKLRAGTPICAATRFFQAVILADRLAAYAFQNHSTFSCGACCDLATRQDVG